MAKIIIVSGATATGKTQLSIELARVSESEIVNFDSLLFYKGMDIGTAKPTLEEKNQIPHHLIDIRTPNDPLNASDYSKLAKPLIDKKLSQNKNLILVGGSGFYLRALLYGMYNSPSTPTEIQTKSNDLYEEHGIEPFIEILKEHDPKSFDHYHKNDHYRIRRAVEHFWTNKTPFSDVREKKEELNQSQRLTNTNGWNLIHFNLLPPKEDHWKIIRKRSEKMIREGLIQEVEDLLKSGLTGKEKPMNSIGYKETQKFLRGELSKDQLIERIYLNTRRLAKSQKTWFKKDNFAKFINPLNIDEMNKIKQTGLNFLSG